MKGEVLSRRTLNRTLLERQMLLRRTSRSPERAIEDLVGMQAQVPGNPYIALWSRLDDFEPDDLSTLISKRGAVRMTLMRATIHLVTADDALALRPVMQPVLERNFYSGSPFGRRIPGADISAILSVGRQLVGEHPRTAAQLRGLLGERWPEEDAEALSMAVRLLVPMVQVPPRGLWKASGQPTWSALEDWLGRPLRGEADVDRVVLRYLAAFGPATVADIRTWSGLGGLREVSDRLRPNLRTFRDENGREVIDLPEAPIADPETPAPPRFLPEYDNVLLSHADRGRVVEEAARFAMSRENAFWSTVLVDGFVAAIWRLREEANIATLEITPWQALSATDRQAVEEEGRRLLAFLAPDATSREVRLSKRED